MISITFKQYYISFEFKPECGAAPAVLMVHN